VGLITGQPVQVRFVPAAENTGLTLVRVDRRERLVIPARPDRVTATARRTTLGGPTTGITLVEHALAALAGLRIDNCRIEVHGPELPGLDGSAGGFVTALQSAGIVEQSASRPIVAPTDPLTLREADATITWHPPAPGAGIALIVSYMVNYGPRSPIAPQRFTCRVTPATFCREIASCRTFLLETEALELRNQGIGRHLSSGDLLVFGPRGPIDTSMRFADEPARHKVLDVLGDLALCGCDLAGHVVAYRSGHALNVALAAAAVARLSAAPLRRSA
jgi:UDP-3-O-acyl N-acetylglucosamine deacetylase